MLNFTLGGMYGRDQGVAQDRGEALIWSRTAADQGLADVQTLKRHLFFIISIISHKLV